MQDFGIVKRLKNGFFEVIREEGIFVRRLEAANPRIKLLSFPESPVKEAEVAVWDSQSSSLVYCAVEGKLYPLNEMESDCIFQTAANKALV